MDGYRIAQQNCYRCHNMGAEGGHMASPLARAGAMAKGSPEFFAKYVRNPQALNPHSKMAASPGYDDQTIAALRGLLFYLCTRRTKMTIRASKALLLFALGFYYTLVVFNNTNDYNSNLTFVRHVLLMDTTYPGNHGMWRAIHAPAVPWLFFGPS
jgi:hypothetical protein